MERASGRYAAFGPAEAADGEQHHHPDASFCEKKCVCYFAGCLSVDVILLLIAIPFLIFVPGLGLVLAALAPGVAILYWTHRYYKDQVTIGQMALTTVECILWMIPLLIWDLLWVLAISPNMNQGGLCSICVLAYAIQSYFFAGFCEELIKYFTINRLANSPMAVDWRCFMVYGICAGAGFAMVENIMYTLSSGYATALVRAFSSVPFHCTTGCLLGIGVAKRRHMLQPAPWWRVILIPWLLHGTYDFILFVGEASHSDIGILGVVGIIILIIGGLSYARYEALAFYCHGNADGSKIADIHDAIVSHAPGAAGLQSNVVGSPRIAMWCQTTECVCDCCCTLWCGCCRATVQRLPRPRAGEHGRGTVDATHPRQVNVHTEVDVPPVPPHEQQSPLYGGYAETRHPRGVPIFGDASIV